MKDCNKAVSQYDVLNCRLDKDVSDKLVSMAVDTGLSKTRIVNRALKEYIEKYNKTGKI